MKSAKNNSRIKKIIYLALLLLLINPISAYTYLNIYLDETGETLFLGETNEQLILPEGIELDKTEIVGKTHSLTNKQGEIWDFSYSLNNAEMNIYLPKGATIKEINHGEISINKNQIIIYVKQGTEIKYTLSEKESEFSWVFYLLGVTGIIAILLYFYKSKQTKKNSGKEKLKIIKQTLNEREQKIIGKLEEVKEIKHSRLQKNLDIPKASFSRHIQELEKKGLIKRNGIGRNKILSLR